MARVRQVMAVPDHARGLMPDNDRIWCHWADCDNPGSALHRIWECMAAPAVRLGNVWGGPDFYTLGPHPELPDRRMCSHCRPLLFCSEQCSAYYQRSHRPGLYGRLPAGVNPRYFLT
jgi:hypothetical protein